MARDGVSRVVCRYPDGRVVEAQTTDWELSGVLARAALELSEGVAS